LETRVFARVATVSAERGDGMRGSPHIDFGQTSSQENLMGNPDGTMLFKRALFNLP
jgi:hypothetical protein